MQARDPSGLFAPNSTNAEPEMKTVPIGHLSGPVIYLAVSYPRAFVLAASTASRSGQIPRAQHP